MAKIKDTSRILWTEQEDTTHVPRLSRHKDDYEDIIQGLREKSDFAFCFKRREIPQYEYKVTRTLLQLKKLVLASDRVRYTAEQVAVIDKLTREEVIHQAEQIIDEMAHTLNMFSIRGFAFLLIKIIKRLYQRVYVNGAGIEQLRTMVQKYPIILMPTHRSYVDFLVLSYICYHYDLPLPVIAAATDFMSMRFFGKLMRNCGAFFIRRTFGMDKLYWAIFTEYVQRHIENSDNPVEFYVEGTRSRTGKSYPPKQGMLSVVLEPVFKAQVPDVMIFPVSISYDRVLEESLYAYEQLGIPKPKESTSGLLKARSVLQENFGNIYIHFGEGISTRQYTDRSDRVVHSLIPRYVYGLSFAEQQLCLGLAYDVVLRHQQLSVISIWALIASVLLQNKRGIFIKSLIQEVNWLKRCTEDMGGYIHWEESDSTEVNVRKQILLHHNIVSVSKDDFVTVKLVKQGCVGHVKNIIVNATTYIMMASYRNHVIHCFSGVGIISIIINSTPLKDSIPVDVLRNKYEFLQTVMSRDFIYKPGSTQKSFDEAFTLLVNCRDILLNGQNMLTKNYVGKYSLFSAKMLEPFLLAYWVICQYLLYSVVEINGRPTAKRYEHVTREVQTVIFGLLRENVIKHYEMLSLNLLSNGLAAVTDIGAVRKERRGKHQYAIVNPVEMAGLVGELALYVEVPNVPLRKFVVQGQSSLLQAKL